MKALGLSLECGSRGTCVRIRLQSGEATLRALTTDVGEWHCAGWCCQSCWIRGLMMMALGTADGISIRSESFASQTKESKACLLLQSPHSLDSTNHELVGASLRGMDETLCRNRHATGGRRWATLHVRCRTSSSSGGTIPQCEAMPQTEFFRSLPFVAL
jgi:hypothetical protein